MDENKSNNLITCNKCDAEVPEGSKFCVECGVAIGTVNDIVTESSEDIINCPNCNEDVEARLKFCPECGTKIQTNAPSPLNTCTYCDADVEVGLKFCTECGKKIRHSKGTLKRDKSNWLDKSLVTINKSSQSLLKNVDNLIDNNIKKSRVPPNVKIEQFKPVRIKGIDNPNPGYLLCDQCGGVYKLKSFESRDDFSVHCECGGKITYLKNLSKT
ncbi:zinc ribbon domain-containing protein [Methanobacterium spitsbergense]|uniref:Zinc ribbon domain-containing protein n=1 Tax=Methanobacterium spitsbergense TaxID=2874285 RepID=A0A8T5UVG0_9EURY|nr:zinc ribbon domain-containing protein [Methanobacterium spitsbergense]MBZ2165906.1 zinc ribbon domain-containing protein [Methanobacterium spitsbergense]